MNVIFTFIFLISLVVFAVFSPDKALEAMTGGGQKAVGLSINLIVIYAVWSGVLQIAEDSGIIKKLSAKLRSPIKLLFGELTDDESDDVAVNISANLLGMSDETFRSRFDEHTTRSDDGYFASSVVFVRRAGDNFSAVAARFPALHDNRAFALFYL